MRTMSWIMALGLIGGGTASAQVDEIDDAEFGGEVPADIEFDDGTGTAERLGETHAVRSGDTLWDLSTQYLNNAWYWPKVWSYNPQLTNPHWIYPGNEVRFYPSDENLPTAVDVSSTELEVPDDDLLIPGIVDEEDLVRTIGEIDTASGVPSTVWSAFTGYLSAESRRFTGQIVGSDEPTLQLDDYSRIYVRTNKEYAVGDELALLRRQRQIRHPITGEFMGYAVEHIGRARVERITPSVTVAQIEKVYRVVERGDYVGDLPANFGEPIYGAPNEVETDGYVVETVGDVIALTGQFDFVYLDQGRGNGVQVGNTFRVLSRGDPLTSRRDGLPYEDIGQLLVIDVQEDGSTALVLTSLRTINVGDRVQMTAQ